MIVLDVRRALPEDVAAAGRGAGHLLPVMISASGPPYAGDITTVSDTTDLNLGEVVGPKIPLDSPLWLPDCDLISAERGRELILDESFEPYFSQLQPLEIAALTGVTVTGDLVACQAEARQRFSAAVLDFTPEEQEAIRWFVSRIRDVCRDQYGLLSDVPWRFLKVQGDLCGGFPHTRATHIIFSERFLNRVVAARQQPEETALRTVGRTFVHEQIHVLERLLPGRFDRLAQSVMGFRREPIKPHAWLTERQISNPDAPDLAWALSVKSEDGRERLVWPRTLLKSERTIPRMGADFWPVAVELEQTSEGWQVAEEAGIPRIEPLSAFKASLDAMLAPPGIDHPNEIAAYVFERVFVEDCVPDPSRPTDSRLQHYRMAFRTLLR